MSKQLAIRAVAGWTQVNRQVVGQELIYDDGLELRYGGTDFSSPLTLDHSSAVDCPIAIDPDGRRGWRYRCQLRLGQRDYSEICEYDLTTGARRQLVRLGLNQWVVWMCRYVPEKKALLVLLATDVATRAGVQIRHSLGLICVKTGRLATIPLCRDAYCPLDYHSSRGDFIFSGAEGFHWVGATGNCLKTLAGADIPRGRGGVFHPHERWAILGGGGLTRWNLADGTVEHLHDQGHWPCWAADFKSIYFSQSSSDLWRMDLESRNVEQILSVDDNPYPEISHSVPMRLSPCGSYLALALTRKSRADNSEGARVEWCYQKAICVVDCKRRQFWTAPVGARYLEWAGGQP